MVVKTLIMWFVVVQFVVVYNISPKHYLFVTCAKINLDYDYKNPFLNDTPPIRVNMLLILIPKESSTLYCP